MNLKTSKAPKKSHESKKCCAARCHNGQWKYLPHRTIELRTSYRLLLDWDKFC